jgi:hypothetical protein
MLVGSDRDTPKTVLTRQDDARRWMIVSLSAAHAPTVRFCTGRI